jgi:hypothetical protein
MAIGSTPSSSANEAVVPLAILRAPFIGIITMRDEKDPKIVAPHIDDPEYADDRGISHQPPHRLKELRRFFLDYKELDGKTVEGAPGGATSTPSRSSRCHRALWTTAWPVSRRNLRTCPLRRHSNTRWAPSRWRSA